MATDWNDLAGELRSALAARDWHQAGAVVWQLRQLDGERFKRELEHYTNEHTNKGGREMTLETEQRLEAVRQWANDNKDNEELRSLMDGLMNGEAIEGDDRSTPNSMREKFPFLDWELGPAPSAYTLRKDMRDVLWSVLYGSNQS